MLLPRLDTLRREDVGAFQSRGIAVIPWVVNEAGDVRRMEIASGCGRHITDRPDVALGVRDGPRPSSAGVAPPDTAPQPPTPWPPPAAVGAAPAVAPAAVDPTRPYDLKEVRTVAATFFTSGDNVDTFLTSLFLEAYGKQNGPHEILDPYQLPFESKDGAPFHPRRRVPPDCSKKPRAGAPRRY